MISSTAANGMGIPIKKRVIYPLTCATLFPQLRRKEKHHV
jgi:hypothetical protein